MATANIEDKRGVEKLFFCQRDSASVITEHGVGESRKDLLVWNKAVSSLVSDKHGRFI
jgi:hypothetical protein